MFLVNTAVINHYNHQKIEKSQYLFHCLTFVYQCLLKLGLIVNFIIHIKICRRNENVFTFLANLTKPLNFVFFNDFTL